MSPLRMSLAIAACLALSTHQVWPADPESRTSLHPLQGESQGRLTSELLLGKLSAARKLGANANPYNSFQEPALQDFLVMHLEFRSPQACANFQLNNAQVIARNDRFADIYLPARDEDINALLANEDLFWVDLGQRIQLPPPPPSSVLEDGLRGIPEEIALGGVDGLTGRGVIIAVIDTGIDFRHPDFIAVDDQGRPVSRILAYWDTFSDLGARKILGSPGPIAYPNGAPVGTVFSRDDLTAELRAGEPRITSWDDDGHGTGCASIAAGNGRGRSDLKHRGVAPQADIVAVRVASGKGASFAHSVYMGAICEWLDRLAGDRPLVVSCSFGGHGGSHDGNNLDERHLASRFLPERPGRALCIAAGNEGADSIHARVPLGTAAAPTSISWNAVEPGSIAFWVQTTNADDILMGFPGESRPEVVSSYVNPVCAAYYFLAVVPAGPGRILLASESQQSLDIDAYAYGDVKFDEDCASPEGTVGTPGTCANAITVASYNWNDILEIGPDLYVFSDGPEPMQIGGLSSYSSRGFTRRHEPKPDIAAPGQWFSGAIARGSDPRYVDSTGHYCPFNGTSSATPYTAGVIALMFEKNPRLTSGEVKDLFHAHASPPAGYSRDRLPDTGWGYGRLDLAAIRKILQEVP